MARGKRAPKKSRIRQEKHHIPYIIYVIREYLPIWMVDFYGELESKYTIYIYISTWILWVFFISLFQTFVLGHS